MKRFVDFWLKRDVSLVTVAAFGAYLTWQDASPGVALVLFVGMLATMALTSWWEKRR